MGGRRRLALRFLPNTAPFWPAVRASCSWSRWRGGEAPATRRRLRALGGLIAAGPWLLRNLLLYGELILLKQMAVAIPTLNRANRSPSTAPGTTFPG